MFTVSNVCQKASDNNEKDLWNKITCLYMDRFAWANTIFGPFANDHLLSPNPVADPF